MSPRLAASTVPGGPARRRRDRDLGAPYLDRFARERRMRTGNRVERPDLPIDHPRGVAPVDGCLGLCDLRRVRDACGRLRRPGNRHARRQATQHADQRAGALGRDAIEERGGRIAGADGDAHGVEHRAGVEPRLHLHDRRARFLVAGKQRALNGRRAAPARQQRRVNVEAAMARPCQDRGRQDESVGRYGKHVDRDREQRRARRLVQQRRRLQHGEAAFQRQPLDGRRFGPEPAPARSVRPREHQRNGEPRVEQRAQHHRRKRRGAGKTDIHRPSRSRLSPRAAASCAAAH